ncbi:MAG: hypothetical protein NW216_14545 [Hyphomicrobium sp.]|nr:hypothetical protein [Hyphomicrobium sp.]
MSRNRIATIAAALAIAGGTAIGIVSPALSEKAGEGLVMVPRKGLMLDVGRKHTVSYFEPQDGACRLTVLIASTKGGSSNEDSPGTRISVPVQPGQRLVIDEAEKQSAEFLCRPGATKMNARVFVRPAESASVAMPTQ